MFRSHKQSGFGFLTIRQAREEDMPAIEAIFTIARGRMRTEGNTSQWNGYPTAELIRHDISTNQGFMVECNFMPAGYFCLQRGEEPTYRIITGQGWPHDVPYLTLHRAASMLPGKGLMRIIVGFALSFGLELRADTHADNKTMRRLLRKYGFRYCGNITLADGSPRLAFYHRAKI